MHDCDEEWGIHKVISLYKQIVNNKDMSNIKHHIPIRSNKFPYCSIQWTSTSSNSNSSSNSNNNTKKSKESDSKSKSDPKSECIGYLHLIDDETQFKHSFGLDIIKNMLLNIEADEEMYSSNSNNNGSSNNSSVYDENIYHPITSKWKIYDWMEYI